jgi:hypothetical protein
MIESKPGERPHLGRTVSQWAELVRLTAASPESRTDAIRALGEIAQTEPDIVTVLFELMVSGFDLRDPNHGSLFWACSRAITDVGAEAAPFLVQELASETRVRHNIAALVIGSMGKPALPTVKEAMDSRPPRERVAIIRGFTEGGTADVENRLVILTSCLGDPDDGVRRAVSSWLTPLGALAVPVLSKALSDPSPRVRNTALEALRCMRGDAIDPLWPQLRALLHDPDATVRGPVALALASSLLLRYLFGPSLEMMGRHDPDVVIRNNISRALLEEVVPCDDNDEEDDDQNDEDDDEGVDDEEDDGLVDPHVEERIRAELLRIARSSRGVDDEDVDDEDDDDEDVDDEDVDSVVVDDTEPEGSPGGWNRVPTANPQLDALRLRGFADLPWYSLAEDVVSTFVARGYQYNGPESDLEGDLTFFGKMAGRDGLVRVCMARGLAVQMTVLLAVEGVAHEQYMAMKSMLTRKYGDPTFSHELFEEPYYEGDGYEEQAIRVGKATFVTEWQHPRLFRLVVGVTPAGESVGVTYESPLWQAESDRRAARQTRDF